MNEKSLLTEEDVAKELRIQLKKSEIGTMVTDVDVNEMVNAFIKTIDYIPTMDFAKIKNDCIRFIAKSMAVVRV